jgi:hypothetical protein
MSRRGMDDRYPEACACECRKLLAAPLDAIVLAPLGTPAARAWFDVGRSVPLLPVAEAPGALARGRRVLDAVMDKDGTGFGFPLLVRFEVSEPRDFSHTHDGVNARGLFPIVSRLGSLFPRSATT